MLKKQEPGPKITKMWDSTALLLQCSLPLSSIALNPEVMNLLYKDLIETKKSLTAIKSFEKEPPPIRMEL